MSVVFQKGGNDCMIEVTSCRHDYEEATPVGMRPGNHRAQMTTFWGLWMSTKSLKSEKSI